MVSQDLLLKVLDANSVVLVSAAHNYYDDFKDSMVDEPSHYADPGAMVDQLPNLIALAGIDRNGFIGDNSPYQDWAAVALGWGEKIGTAVPIEDVLLGEGGTFHRCVRFPGGIISGTCQGC